jgi:hypothetical protein
MSSACPRGCCGCCISGGRLPPWNRADAGCSPRSGARSTWPYKVFADARELRELLLNDLATLLTERFSGVGHSERPYMVPSPVTAFVGRDHDTDEVVKMLEALDRRLTVLTGTGVLLDLDLLELPKPLRRLSEVSREKCRWPGSLRR